MSTKQTRKNDCYAEGCMEFAAFKIRESQMCAKHYIEALEHCAHILTPKFDKVTLTNAKTD